MNDILSHIALSSNECIGPVRYQKIIAQFGNCSTFLSLSTEDQMAFTGVRNPKAIPLFRDMIQKSGKLYQECIKKNITILPWNSQEYPAKLRNIPGAPFILYQRGTYRPEIPLIGVVGTRDYTDDAASINRMFVRELVSYNLGIVSGLAKGHDGISQTTALDSEGYTIGVLGSGIDIPYPRENTRLYDQVIEKGCVFSEYPPGAPSDKRHFPLRNRIISGLSEAILLIQAPERSGALITAKYAAEQGKDLYAIPGPLGDPHWTGNNLELQKGAKLILRPDEIVLDILGKKTPKRERMPQKALTQDLSPEETQVLKHLQQETAFEELALMTGINALQLNHLLTKMEIGGLVSQLPGRYYTANR